MFAKAAKMMAQQADGSEDPKPDDKEPEKTTPETKKRSETMKKFQKVCKL